MKGKGKSTKENNNKDKDKGGAIRGKELVDKGFIIGEQLVGFCSSVNLVEIQLINNQIICDQ